jgi:hypothetical protein
LTTIPAGLAADDFFTAVGTIRTASAALRDTITLDASFGANVRGIGAAALANSTNATIIQNTGNGAGGSGITLTGIDLTNFTTGISPTAAAGDSFSTGHFTLTYDEGLKNPAPRDEVCCSRKGGCMATLWGFNTF